MEYSARMRKDPLGSNLLLIRRSRFNINLLRYSGGVAARTAPGPCSKAWNVAPRSQKI